MSWIKLTSVTATNGSNIVAVNSGSTAGISVGDALKIGAFDVYEITGVFASQLQLRENWGNATTTATAATVVPTFGDFNAAIAAMRDLTDTAVSNLSALEDWGTHSGTVSFKGQDGTTYAARTLQQMDDDVAVVEASAIAAGVSGFANAVAAVSGGRNILRTDAFGNAQLVCRIPLCTYEDLNVPGCPFTGAVDAFRRADGTLRPYVDICIHEAANVGGKAVSQAGLDPWASINTDTSRARCEELGTGWHMMGAYERALLGWIMLSKNFQPRGNTEYGRAYNAINEFGQRQDGLVPNDRSGAARVLTGSGPDEWRHDGTPFGVSNLVGNVWERDEGWKMIGGQFYVAEYLGQAEVDWAATGRYINSGHVLSMMPPPSPVASNQVWVV